MGVKTRRDVGVVDPRVHGTDALVVDHHDGVAALRGDVRDERVGIGVCEARAVVAFGAPGVDEYETCRAGAVDERGGVDVNEIPV